MTSRTNPAALNQLVPAPSQEATARKLDFLEDTDSAVLDDVQAARIAQAEVEQNIMRLEEKRDEYVERLDLGASKIETARMQGKDVTMWEDYWIQLLHQYEAVCDKLRDLYTEI